MDEDQRHLKKQWLAGQKATARKAFPLPDRELTALFAHVDHRVAESGCDHSLRFTLSWLEQHQHGPEQVVAWLEDNGGLCDCEVVANARDHWDQNRN